MDEMNSLTVDQKFAKAMLVLKDLRPFYSSIYEVMNKHKKPEISTMAVTGSELWFNSEFCDKLSFPEFMFVVLHEIGHIALLHVPRCSGRDRELWNIACDLYVNKVLRVEFESNHKNIQMPEGAVYWDKIDIEKDAVETIYDELYNQAKQNGYFSKPSWGGQSGQSAGGQNEQSAGDQNGQSAGGQNGQSAGGQNGQNQNGQSNSGFGKKYTFKLSRGGSEYTFDIDVNYQFDIVPVSGNSAEIESESRRLLSDAQVRNQLLNGTSAGDDAGQLERLCQKLLESKLNWRKLIRKYLIAYSQSDTSYAKPDKRMYWQNAVYPGPISSRPDMVKGIKICIDTSGSISDEDMAEFLGHIYKLARQFKIDADLIYWDAEIQSGGKLKNVQDIQRIDILGGGGTNPACVFESLDKERTAPILTVMLTDGYFPQRDLDNRKWKKRYKNTLWIICEKGDKDFKAEFGKVAELRVGLTR